MNEQDNHVRVADDTRWSKEMTVFGKSSISKAEKWGWADVGERGEFMLVAVGDLFIDESYQRCSSREKVIAIARSFDWRKFGAIVVALRGDNSWVIDGAHRVRAAMLRGIDEVPAMVFDSGSVRDEAAVFYDSQKSRAAITSIEGHKAGVVAGHELANKVEALVTGFGYRVEKGGHSARGVQCVRHLEKIVARDEDLARAVFAMFAKHDQPIIGVVIEGVFGLAIRMREQLGLKMEDSVWGQRVGEIGSETLALAIQRVRIVSGLSGGELSAVRGVLSALNNKRRNKLQIEV